MSNRQNRYHGQWLWLQYLEDEFAFHHQVHKCIDYRRVGLWRECENRCAVDPLQRPPNYPWALRGKEGQGYLAEVERGRA